MTGTWGAYMQNNNFETIDKAGAALNLHIGCAVHYPAFDKRLFECKCNIIFPAWMVEAAVESNDWSTIEQMHRGEL